MRGRRPVCRVGVTLKRGLGVCGPVPGRAARVTGLARGDGRAEPGPGAVQPLGADRGELLAPLPQAERLLKGQAARLELLDYAAQLVAGLLIRQGITVSHERNPTRRPSRP